MKGAAFLTPLEIAAETGLHPDVVRRAIRSGELKATQPRRRLLVRRDWFDAWIEANVSAPAPKPVRSVPVMPAAAMSAKASGSLDRLRAIERGEL